MENNQEKKLQKLHRRLCACAVFRGVLKSTLLSLFVKYCKAESIEEKLNAYADFVSQIYEEGGSLTEAVKNLVFTDENVYIKNVARGKTLSKNVLDAAKMELDILSQFASLTSEDFGYDMEIPFEELPKFDSVNAYLGALYEERLQNIHKCGYGIFSAFGMFRFHDEKGLAPILAADKIGLEDFIGYDEERKKIIDNTKAFVQGKPAANVLLYGDAGTGKSSTVKAVANVFFDEGVRLIELRKDQLRCLPEVMAKLYNNPLKFIIFIDDLSFNQNNDDFSMLKATLEGSASATAENAVIYATSNRRHVVKEKFSDREGDDVHRNDTLQETLSLSERFGLTVFFSKPSKSLYLKIVQELAKQKKLDVSEKELELKAEEFALRKGNRSARAARQFINSLL